MKNILLISFLTLFISSCFNSNGVVKTDIVEKLEKKTNLNFKSEKADFNDYIDNRTYNADKYSLKASGGKVKNYIWLVSETRIIFSRNRYEEDIRYAADGPTGHRNLLREGKREIYHRNRLGYF